MINHRRKVTIQLRIKADFFHDCQPMMRFDSLKQWLNWQESLHPRSIDLGLNRVTKVFKALYPEYVKPITITVAGTNGKGSCIAFLEAIYRNQGYRVGTYTSPHLEKYNERIKINGKPVSDELICSAFERIEQVRNNISLSYFEFSTLAALDIFSRSGVEIQLLEVGLGGRLDAVNIVDPDVSIVTSICIDHVDWLGDTREKIGKEKAGIFREGIPAIVGDPKPPDSLNSSAHDRGAPIFFIGKDFGFDLKSDRWDWFGMNLTLTNLPIPSLKGSHQFRNASTAILAVMKLRNLLPVSDDHILRAIKKVNLPGRFQLIDGETQILLDVGHNPQAVKMLKEHLLEYFPGKCINAVFSMMKDKDIKTVLAIMKPIVKNWFFAPLPNNSRCASEIHMRECFNENGIENVSFGHTDFSDAFQAAEQKSQKGDLILIFGSFFLVSEYLFLAKSS